MIKRRFYRQEHRDKSGGSSSSDSDSDSNSAPQSDEQGEVRDEEDEDEVEEEEANDDGNDEKQEEEQRRSPSFGSGYESEDSSANEVEGYSSGLFANVEVDVSESVGGNHKDNQLNVGVRAKENKVITENSSVDMNDPIQADFANYILTHKSVFKCRLCPRIVCLSEDTVKAHLKSKRHSRSKKLLGEGRLKLILNSDGEIEEDQETHSERHVRTLALAEELNAAKKRDSGRQRQNRRRKKRLRNRSDKVKTKMPTEKPKKKRLKAGDGGV